MNSYRGIDERIVKYVQKYARILDRKIFDKSIDDLEQELMCYVYKSINKFDSNRGSFERFLIRILSCALKNIIKMNKRHFIPTSKIDIEFIPSVDNIGDISVEAKIADFPNRYRLIHTLLKQYTIVDIAKIMNVSRVTIHRDLKDIQRYFRKICSYDSGVYLLGSNLKMKNLSTIELLSTKELSELAVYDLADLSEQMSHLVNHTKELKEKLEDALNLRFLEIAQNNLRSENRDTGTTKFIENGFQIVAEVPKKVTWDSEKIDEIIKNISDEKRKAIIKTTHVIDERKYQQLSPEDKTLFADARTITPGKAKFKISIPNSEEA